jgi:hypothetical protein
LDCNLPFNILFGTVLSSILSTRPNHLILCDLIYLTISSPFYNVFISWLCLSFHILLSVTGPYILRIIFLSDTLNMLSSIIVKVHVSASYIIHILWDWNWTKYSINRMTLKYNITKSILNAYRLDGSEWSVSCSDRITPGWRWLVHLC